MKFFHIFIQKKKKKKANVTCKSQKKWLVMPKPKRHITANQVVVAMLVSGKKKKKKNCYSNADRERFKAFRPD
jgi:DNA-directed RNA polymerase subunit E'/Rpb7